MSCDCATAVQPGGQSETLSQKIKNNAAFCLHTESFSFKIQLCITMNVVRVSFSIEEEKENSFFFLSLSFFF